MPVTWMIVSFISRMFDPITIVAAFILYFSSRKLKIETRLIISIVIAIGLGILAAYVSVNLQLNDYVSRGLLTTLAFLVDFAIIFGFGKMRKIIASRRGKS